MHLKSIYLHGFKSFARATEMKFGRELTTIVGPNGSGKSNVLDAIRWALGEQSLKVIRGKKSTDVLFSGSTNKSRASFAEVSLVLDNQDHALPLDFAEVTVTRKLYRDGESEYLLAGRPTRLQDIVLMLAQANFGQKSYSIVSQGMVDSIINATPSERLLFFIEATGVKQYQIRRDDALNKLNLTTANLQEAGSRLAELTPILNSLSRQVKKLQKREQLVTELQQWQHTYYYHRLKKINDEKIILYRRLSEAQTKQQQQREAVNNCRHQLTTISSAEQRTELFARLQAQHTQTLAKRDEILRHLAEAQGLERRQLKNEGRGNEAWVQEQQQQLHSALDTLEQKLTAAKERQQHAASQLTQHQQQSQQIEQALQEAEAALNEILNMAAKPPTVDVVIIVKETSVKLKKIIQEIKKQSLDPEGIILRLQIIIDNLDKIDAPAARPSVQLIQQSFQRARQKHDAWQAARQQYALTMELAQQEAARLKEAVDQARDNLKNLNQTIGPSSGHIAVWEKQLKEVESLLDKYTAQLTKAHEQAQDLEQQRSRLQTQLQLATEQLAKADAGVAEIQVDIARWQTQSEDLSLEINKELHQAAEDIANDLQLQPNQESSLTAWEEKIQRFKEQVAQIGGIDSEIVAEYQQIKQRHEFLTTQTKDLNQALGQLQQVIKELDKIIGQQFNTNFKRINQEFSHFFKTLFSGGRAGLKLENLAADQESLPETDTAEEIKSVADKVKFSPVDLTTQHSPLANLGIIIDACPPDKKITTVQALSGGERALMSTALLCAIVACNPSPFVVMDEVDAALDEANAERLANIFKELNKKTQIIVITHNRVIMQHADVLYGVTMDSDGISRVLSLSLKDAEKLE